VTKSNFALLIAYSLLVTISAGFASYFVCVWTHSFVAMEFTMVLIIGVGMIFTRRWWLRIARIAGLPTVEWTPSRITFAIAYVSAMLLAIAVNYANYAFTGSRVSEITVSLVAFFPALAFLAWKGSKIADPPKPQEAPMLRFSFYGQYALAIIFLMNLAIQLRPTYHDYGFSTLHNLIIASYIVIVPLFPINAYYFRRRYLQASQSATPLPT
jgi:hypothetical protein